MNGTMNPVERMARRFVRGWVVVGVAVMTAMAAEAQSAERRFVLREYFGHAWKTDLVCRTFTVGPEEAWRPEMLRLFLDDNSVPMQLDRMECHADGTLRRADVWFRSDLPAGATHTFVLRPAVDTPTPKLETPVTLTTAENRLLLDNGLAAVRLPAGTWQAPADASRAVAAGALATHLGAPPGGDDAPGPILGLRLASGRWTGASRIRPFEALSSFIHYAPQQLFQNVDATTPAGRVLSYHTTIEANGPLITRVRIDYTFVDDGTYTLVAEVRAGEPLVRLDERYHKAGTLVIDFDGYAPTTAHTMLGNKSTAGQTTALTYASREPRALFVGYNYYFPQIGMAFGLTGDPVGDVTGLLATDPDWLPYPYNQGIHLVTEPGPKLSLRANLHQGQRHWAFLAAGPDFLAHEDAVPGLAIVAWWHRRVACPLSKVAGWRVDWEGMADAVYPHLFCDAAELPAIRERLASQPAVEAAIQKITKDDHKNFVSAALYLATGETQHLERLRNDNPFALIDTFNQAILAGRGMNFSPLPGRILEHTDALSTRLVAMDLLLGSDLLSAAEKTDALRKLALLTAYLHDTHWLPTNDAFDPSSDAPYPGYVQGTPNMKTCFIFARATLACLLRDHPDQPRWIRYAMDDFARVMPVTVHESGALLESPFYSARDTMRWGPFWTALARKGAPKETVDTWLERHKRAFIYLTDMLTPPEPRFGGRRVYHPIGRSSSGVVDPTFALTGLPWGATDPAFAARMCWAWNEQQQPNLYLWGATGGRDLAWTFLGFNRNWTPLAVAPLASIRYKGMGAIFRARVGTDHESNVLFRHDPFCWDLYPGNNGAVYFYGKGSPLLPRLGGYWNHKPWLMSPPFGNRLLFADDLTDDTAFTNGLGVMESCALLGDLADAATGITRAGDWRRRVLYAKDLHADDPAYLLVRDDVFDTARPNATHWWVLSKAVQPDGITKPGVVPTHGYSDKEWIDRMGTHWQDAPRLTGQTHRFEGHFGVDLDLFIAWPENPKIVSDAVGAQKMAYASERIIEIAQLVRIEQEPGGGHLALFMPSRTDGAKPVCRTLADGSGVAVTCGAEEARLFAAAKTITYTDPLVTFSGAAGFVRRGGATALRLMVQEGTITAEGFTLETPAAAALVYDGITATVTATDRETTVVRGPPGIPLVFR